MGKWRCSPGKGVNVGIFFRALAGPIAPALWSAVLIHISDDSLKQSIHRAGMELL